MFDGPEYDRNGKINQSAYSSDEYDFFKTMYGDKGEYKATRSSGIGGPFKVTKDESGDGKIHCSWGKFGWYMALFGCFAPIG